MNRLRSLDGLRAISIMMVFCGHLAGTRHNVELPPIFNSLPHLGVAVFFVISGFLITTLLLDEERRFGNVSLKQFYVRRTLRIMPAALVFIGIMCLADLLGWASLPGRDIAAALTWTMNFLPGRSWGFGHLWSLSVEEQFYLLWPITFIVAGAYRRQWVVLAMFLMAPVVRAAMHILLKAPDLRDLEIFPAVCDGIAIGCLVALNRDALSQNRWWQRISRPALALPILLIAIVVGDVADRYTIVDLICTPLILVGIAAVVEGATRWEGASVRFLNHPLMVRIGVLSYSLYLWQQPFLNRHSSAWVASFPVNLMCAVLCATASYYWVEQPLRELRRYFYRRPPSVPSAMTAARNDSEAQPAIAAK